jgi:predicted cobalt transporter CbtA
VATALCTAAGLALIAFVPRGWAALLAIVLLVAPHLYGAPLPPDGAHALAPEALAHRFQVVATVTSLVFWAALGVLTALFLGYFSRESRAA